MDWETQAHSSHLPTYLCNISCFCHLPLVRIWLVDVRSEEDVRFTIDCLSAILYSALISANRHLGVLPPACGSPLADISQHAAQPCVPFYAVTDNQSHLATWSATMLWKFAKSRIWSFRCSTCQNLFFFTSSFAAQYCSFIQRHHISEQKKEPSRPKIFVIFAHQDTECVCNTSPNADTAVTGNTTVGIAAVIIEYSLRRVVP